MKVSLILLLVAIAVAVTLAANEDKAEDEELWKDYKSKFVKKHKSKHDAKRKSHFLETEKKIKKHNKGKSKWKMAHNKFSDMTTEEKLSYIGTTPLKKKPKGGSAAVKDDITIIQERQDALPDTLDLRTDRCLIPPKDQGVCGSCWAFATITPIEFQTCKKTGNPVSLSEQQIADCTYFEGRDGCRGGWYFKAWDALIKTGAGVSTGIDYSYVSGKTNTSGTCQVTGPGADNSPRVASWDWTTPWFAVPPIQTALIKYGPIPVTLKVIDSLYSFGKGIYDDPACNNASNVWDTNHAVSIVGYGTKSGTDFWIVRNSWGIFWGDGGYFYIKRGVNQCQIESYSAYMWLK